MSNSPSAPKTSHGSKSGIKPGDHAQSESEGARDKRRRPVEEEDVFGGAERNHDGRVSSDKAKP